MAQPYVGEIRMFAGNFAPVGWMLCDGQTIPISENETLFQLIGTTYGGDGEETFQLPNLQSRIPIHMGTGPDGTNYQLAEAAGVEEVTLTTQQIPVHTHTFLASNNLSNNPDPSGQQISQSSLIKMYIEDIPNQPMNTSGVTPAGNSQPHTNLMPYICINYIISLFGIFPTQN